MNDLPDTDQQLTRGRSRAARQDPPPQIARPPRRGQRVAWVLLSAVVLASVGLFELHEHEANGGGAVLGEKIEAFPVAAVAVTSGDIDTVLSAIGTVTPLATVTIKTQINGQLQRVGFTEGQLVHRGDFLAQIDPRPYEASLEQYMGQLGKDQAQLRQAQTDLTRYQRLLKADSIARQQPEDQAFVVQQYEAAVRSDQGLVDTQKLDLTYCRIVSPVDGRVGLRQVDPGNYLQTTDTTGLVVVTQTQPISAVFALPEDDLPAVLKRYHSGETLKVVLFDRANDTELATGDLSTIDNQVDTTTGTWKLRALFPNGDEMLFPNQFVNVRLTVSTLHDVLTVPAAAVQRGEPGTYVYVVGADGKVAVQPVKTGVADGAKVQIVAGLAKGDRVVLSGFDRLQNGAPVKIQADTPTAATP
jgi:multidrug efflux system membrane fusion protein